MKRVIAALLLLSLTLSLASALASDYPFVEGVNYFERYREYQAVPSMLNFGCATLRYGEDLYSVPKITIKNETTETVQAWQDEGKFFYIYAKWEYGKGFDSTSIDAMLVLTDPLGRYYATYGQWDLGYSRKNSVYSWFFDTTDMLRRCREENGGALPKGSYVFQMFFNNKSFRLNEVTLN